MLPIRHKSIFRSRWAALLWAGGIIWSAVEFVGDQPPTAPGNQAENADGAPLDAATQAALNRLGAP